jgi:hypothetical protein
MSIINVLGATTTVLLYSYWLSKKREKLQLADFHLTRCSSDIAKVPCSALPAFSMQQELL